jgi:brefeldin A-resistance guanine nucleotide exchange factor 1
VRDGWRNILDCVAQLHKARLLPAALVECEDYVAPSGRISLAREAAPSAPKASEAQGLFSFFPFMAHELAASKGPSQEELDATRSAHAAVRECHIEQLVHDTKFLRLDSLLELVKALVFASQAGDSDPGSPLSAALARDV